VELASRFGLEEGWQLEYRKLNSVTIQDSYPLWRIDESLDALARSMFFSMLGLLSGYWLCPLTPDTQDKTPFIRWDEL